MLEIFILSVTGQELSLQQVVETGQDFPSDFSLTSCFFSCPCPSRPPLPLFQALTSLVQPFETQLDWALEAGVVQSFFWRKLAFLP